MQHVTKLTLANGRAVYVEAEDPTQSGDRELSTTSEARITEVAFDIVSATLAEVATNLEEHLSRFGDRGPQKIVVEIHAEVKAGGTVFILNGGVGGGIKVQLSWERNDR